MRPAVQKLAESAGKINPALVVLTLVILATGVILYVQQRTDDRN